MRLQIFLLATTFMRTSLYIRLEIDKHRRFCAYARRVGISANMAAEMLIDQLLAQIDPGFRWPDWLREAVAAGELPLQTPDHVDQERHDEDEQKAPAEGSVLRAV